MSTVTLTVSKPDAGCNYSPLLLDVERPILAVLMSSLQDRETKKQGVCERERERERENSQKKTDGNQREKERELENP